MLFDLDGTLLDTLEDIGDSVNKALDDLGFPQHEMGEYRYFIGEGIVTLAARALPEKHGGPAMVEKLLVGIRAEYARRWADRTRPYEGVPEMLDALTVRGSGMAVLSNKPHDFTQLAVTTLLSKWRFEVVMGATPSRPKKPDPAGALETARRMNLTPSQFAYVGDSGIDMETASAAGMYGVGALWGFRPASELLASGAKELIEKPGELLKLL